MAEMGPPKTFFVGVKGIIVQKDKVLLLRKDIGRVFWDAPGGRINGRETIPQTLLRELHEELPSIEGVTIGELLYACVLDRDIKDDISLNLLFYRIDVTMKGDVVLSSEHSDYKWMTFEEAIEKGSEGIPEAVALLDS
ncbi:MAG TPA: NUDIX domain-containing protein [Candidatus Saccharimonadales bacterium]|nr:NUDIX domain-containing protein [Candidatus Saccharimonadales bacterium]